MFKKQKQLSRRSADGTIVYGGDAYTLGGILRRFANVSRGQSEVASRSTKQSRLPAAKEANRTNIMIFVTDLKQVPNVIMPRNLSQTPQK
jgi:hypothetical protein